MLKTKSNVIFYMYKIYKFFLRKKYTYNDNRTRCTPETKIIFKYIIINTIVLYNSIQKNKIVLKIIIYL